MNHLALLDQNILELVPKHDLVLIDTGYFDYLPRNYDFSKALYATSTLYQLEELVPKLKEVKENIDWRLDHVIRQKNVYTIPEVIVEMSNFEAHLAEVYSHYQKLLKKEAKPHFHSTKYIGYNDALKESDRSFVRRSNLLKEKTRFFAKEDHIDFVREGKGLQSLENMLASVRRVSKETKIYNGQRQKIYSHNFEFSETDYKLVETALGSIFKNNYGKVMILTSDSDLGKILNAYQKNELPPQQSVKLKGICIYNLFMREIEARYQDEKRIRVDNDLNGIKYSVE